MEIRGERKRKKKDMEVGGDGDFGTREYDCWDSVTRKEKREREGRA